MLTALVDADYLAALTDRERQILDQVAGIEQQGGCGAAAPEREDG